MVFFPPQLTANMKITNPFYFPALHSRGLLEREWRRLQRLERQLPRLSLTSSGSSCGFLQAKRGVS